MQPVRIDIPAFKGMAPRVSPALLESVQGVFVTGTVTSGELRPWRVSAPVESCPADTESIYLAATGDWISWDEVVHAHPSVSKNDAFGRIYYTRESGGLFVVSPLDDFTEFRAGVPKPETPPTVVVSGSGSGTAEDRVYCYTYVNAWGEEGAPSEPSDFESWQPGQTVTVSGFAVPPLGYKAVVAIRIYRMAIGDVGADWFYVDEIVPTGGEYGSYVDAVSELALGEAISTLQYDLPPQEARGLVALGNGIMAVFQDNEIAFCEPYLPYAWPDGFRLSVAGGVVSLGVVGSSVVVLTNTAPYYIHMAHPSIPVLSPDNFSQTRLAEKVPCVSPRGVVSTEWGVIFPAPDGLRVLDGSGPSKLLTEALLSAQEWVSIFDPLNVRGAYFDGQYFGFQPGSGFSYHPSMGLLTWTGSGAMAMHTDGLSLYIARDGSIYEWASDVGLTEAVFKSKVFRFPRPVNMAAVRVDSSMDTAWEDLQALYESIAAQNELLEQNDLSLADEDIAGQSVGGDNLEDLPLVSGDVPTHGLKIWADGNLVFDNIVPASGYSRLPSGFLAREWQFELRTFSHVKQITLGTSTRAAVGA